MADESPPVPAAGEQNAAPDDAPARGWTTIPVIATIGVFLLSVLAWDLLPVFHVFASDLQE